MMKALRRKTLVNVFSKREYANSIKLHRISASGLLGPHQNVVTSSTFNVRSLPVLHDIHRRFYSKEVKSNCVKSMYEELKLPTTTSGLPRFSSLDLQQLEPLMTHILQELEHKLGEIEKSVDTHIKQETLSFETFLDPLEKCFDPLTKLYNGVIGHLNSVLNSEEIRSIHQELQPKVISFYSRISQSEELYRAYKHIKETERIYNSLTEPKKRILDQLLMGSEHGGVGLKGEERNIFNAVQVRLGELSTLFSNNLLDSSNSFGIWVENKEALDGLPMSTLQLASQNAKKDGKSDATPENGPWKLTLEAPIYLPVMKYCTNEGLRKQLYLANITKASDTQVSDGFQGSCRDNLPVLLEILKKREVKAKKLGFNNFAELSVAKKMAGSVADVESLLDELKEKCYPSAMKEISTLQSFANQHGAPKLELWDVAFWTEKRRKELFSFTEEELKSYFPLPNVLEGLFELCYELFDISIRQQETHFDNHEGVEVWHKDVSFFNVYGRDSHGQEEHIASFYLDPFSRPENKNKGAWMNSFSTRAVLKSNGSSNKDSLQLPTAYLVLNASPPSDSKPSHLTFDEVVTLFHEFGHGLQHMLTDQTYLNCSGINGVEWDAVEIPSQLMENFCYSKNVLSKLTTAQKPLPEDLFTQLVESRKYMAANAMLRQLSFATLDLKLHQLQISQLDEQQAKNVVLSEANAIMESFASANLRPLEEDRFICSFSHIFAGGYAAGYYSYKWAEVFALDAFDAFEEENDMRQTGRRLRETILSKGGGEHPIEVFKKFRGREQKTDALLKAYGLN